MTRESGENPDVRPSLAFPRLLLLCQKRFVDFPAISTFSIYDLRPRAALLRHA